jgi:hypothetical protein
MKRTILAWSLTAIAFLASAQLAYAARIYNYTAATVWISGGLGGIDLGPGKKSDSIEWKGTHFITVGYQDPNRVHYELCRVGKIVGNDLVGGNYLLIHQNGRTVNCTLCDSDRRTISSGSGQFPASVPNKNSGSQGC